MRNDPCYRITASFRHQVRPTALEGCRVSSQKLLSNFFSVQGDITGAHIAIVNPVESTFSQLLHCSNLMGTTICKVASSLIVPVVNRLSNEVRSPLGRRSSPSD